MNVVFLIVIGTLVTVAGIVGVKHSEKEKDLIMAGILAIIFALVVYLVGGYTIGYRAGQIDALEGDIKYEKVSNTSVEWEEIDE